ncbi:alkaline phosphatase family protein [Nocardioides sp. SR21]|uniref:alkaline phosphatase family protein n=1 Tax=Nocardioides sp. SR21 TaxID=2919501 RepID=UPI001FAB3035|nr:alkaline phosphatase family protein [Nocardioides sp. SR21]
MRTPAALVLAAAVLLGGAAPAHAITPEPVAPPSSVVAISVDGLNVEAVRQLGAAGAPTLHRMLDEGAGTLNARTELEQTVTLPNHTSMLTGRRIDADAGGHGVTWDGDRPGTTVQGAAGHPVGSVFSAVHTAGGSAALYTTKEKFELYERSWPAGVDTCRFTANQRRLVRLARADLADGAPTFTFLHVSLPDRAGHAYGGMSPQYLDAVRRTDKQLGTVLRAVAGHEVTVILTADHGFATGATDHSAKRNVENYRIPFLVWGSGVAHSDLYATNPTFRDPRGRRPAYAGKQPVRNGDVANLALDLLGLGPVRGSGIDPEQTLSVD